VLAYSGELDTSVILKWLQDVYRCEVVTFTADLGQGEELEPAWEKALLFGIKAENIFIDDLREEFVRNFVFPMFSPWIPQCSSPRQIARAWSGGATGRARRSRSSVSRCLASRALTIADRNPSAMAPRR